MRLANPSTCGAKKLNANSTNAISAGKLPRRAVQFGAASPAGPLHRRAAASITTAATATIEAPATTAAAQPVPGAGAATTTLRFAIQCPCAFGESMAVVGSAPALGAWSPAGALQLTWNDGHVWSGAVEVARGERVEFKFLRATPHGPPAWEPAENRHADVPAGAAAELVVEAAGWGLPEVTLVGAAPPPAASAPPPAALAAVDGAAAAAAAEAAAAAAALKQEVSKLKDGSSAALSSLGDLSKQISTSFKDLAAGKVAAEEVEEKLIGAVYGVQQKLGGLLGVKVPAPPKPAAKPKPAAAAAVPATPAAPAASSKSAAAPAPPATSAPVRLPRQSSRGTTSSANGAAAAAAPNGAATSDGGSPTRGLTRSSSGRRSSRRTSMSIDANMALDEYLGSGHVQVRVGVGWVGLSGGWLVVGG